MPEEGHPMINRVWGKLGYRQSPATLAENNESTGVIKPEYNKIVFL